MARLEVCGSFREQQLGSAGTWKTVAAIEAPSNHPIAVKRVKVTGSGIAGDAAPIDMRLTRITSGTGTATTSAGQVLNNSMSETPQATFKEDYTVEPTEDGTNPYLYPAKFHPQGGSVDEVTFDDVVIAGGTGLALECKVPSGGTQIYVTGHIIYEE